MTPLVVVVAPNRARRTKADHANLPITPAEIAREAERCCAAGGTVLHVRVRDQQVEVQPPDLLPFLAAHDGECPWAACASGRAKSRGC